MRSRLLAPLAASLLVAGSARAEAPSSTSAPAAAAPAPRVSDPPIPDRRLVLNNLLAFRYNPLGLEDQLRAGFQQRLYQSDKPLLRDNFFFGGVYPKVNPAFTKIGPSLEIQPLSIFNLRLGAELIGYYSTFGLLQSYRSPLDDFSESALRRGKDAKRNYAAYGLHVMIEPSVQLRFGPIVLRDKLAVEHWRVKLRAGDRVFYDVTADTAIGSIGWVIQNDLDLLYQRELTSLTGKLRGARLTAGVRYTTVQPLYDAADFAPTDDRSRADNGHHRLGPLLAFTFFDDGYSRFNKPTAIVIANWYLDHRFRTGADSSAALPYLVLGFAFQSDLLE